MRSRGETYHQSESLMMPPREERTPWSLLLLERGLVPDSLIRWRIRQLLRQRLHDEDQGSEEANQAQFMRFVTQLRDSPIAIHTKEANEQHYELPPSFFERVLGPNLKYSSCYYAAPDTTLEEAELAMLRLTVERARIAGEERILELGCGWGSLTLYMAARFPSSHITAVSNSNSQREFIQRKARERGLTNVTVITCDANVLSFPFGTQFDRVVSVEMFEHMRNYQTLFSRIASWLRPGGSMFVHIFTHREFAYPFDVRDATDWMAKYFFTGGIMPSDHLLHYFQDEMRIQQHWRVDGHHYQRTAEDWLKNMDGARDELRPVMRQTYGEHAEKWWEYWRVFFMSCAELWGYKGGREWFVSHYLFEKPTVKP